MAIIEKNSDGSCIVKLDTPVKVDGETISRVTVPKITGRHLFTCPVINAGTPIGVAVEWASKVVTPAGAVEVMEPADAVFVAQTLLGALGKSHPTGEPPSP